MLERRRLERRWALILRGLLGVIDHDHFDRGFLRFQFETELLLKLRSQNRGNEQDDDRFISSPNLAIIPFHALRPSPPSSTRLAIGGNLTNF
jgi:hypothetical protein